MNLEGIRAIVTGASSGIGLATVRALIQAGAARVGVLARNQEKLDAAMHALEQEQPGGRAVPMLADVRDGEALAACFAEYVKLSGGLDVPKSALGWSAG